MTPSRNGRMTSMVSGARPYISRASCPTATILDSATAMATTVGSCRTISPPSHTSVLTVPRSMPRSLEKRPMGGFRLLAGGAAAAVVHARRTPLARHLKAQARAAQGRLGRQVGVGVRGQTRLQRLFGALAGLF